MSEEDQKENALESVGEAADRIDNLLGALQLPLPPAMHLNGISGALPEIRDQLRAAYVALTGDDPWEEVSDGWSDDA